MSVLKLLLAVLLLFAGVTSVAPPVVEPVVVKPAVAAEKPAVAVSKVEAAAVAPAVAQCLAQKGVKLYGAYWCQHCADQKKIFGEDIKYIDYIECDSRGENARAEECAAQKITSFPTWVFADSERLIGTRNLDELAEKAGCN
ncbi:hypothetical protein KKA13_03245 [Patescibacteria group bacterium]|nr:hypothetical protein [Patescibacteria group bacterium]